MEIIYFKTMDKAYKGVNLPLESFMDKYLYGDCGLKKVLVGNIVFGVNGNEISEEQYNKHLKNTADIEAEKQREFFMIARTEGFDVEI